MKLFYITSKLFALFMALLGAFMAYFVVTDMYFSDLAFAFEPFWAPYGEKYIMLDAIIWITLGIMAYLNLIFTTMDKRNIINLALGGVGFFANVGMCFLWQEMEVGNGVTLDLAVFCLLLVTVYNLLGALVFLFARIPAISEQPTSVVEESIPTLE